MICIDLFVSYCTFLKETEQILYECFYFVIAILSQAYKIVSISLFRLKAQIFDNYLKTMILYRIV